MDKFPLKQGRIATFLLLLTLALTCFGCAVDSGSDDNETTDSTFSDGGSSIDTDDGIAIAQIPLVRFFSDDGTTLGVQVELARTLSEQQTGLMFRESLDEFEGMLFLFDTETTWSFTMENTLIPLDMIHLDADWNVV